MVSSLVEVVSFVSGLSGLRNIKLYASTTAKQMAGTMKAARTARSDVLSSVFQVASAPGTKQNQMLSVLSMMLPIHGVMMAPPKIAIIRPAAPI